MSDMSGVICLGLGLPGAVCPIANHVGAQLRICCLVPRNLELQSWEVVPLSVPVLRPASVLIMLCEFHR